MLSPAKGGYTLHPDYEAWIRDGYLVKDYNDLTADGTDDGLLRGILAMTSGGDFVQSNLSFVPREVEHLAADTQYQMHLDTFHSILKMWIYDERMTIERGPLHLVPGSNRNSRGKLQWMYGRTKDNSPETLKEPSLRLTVNETEFGFRPQVPVLPLPGVAATLVIADTSGLHHRGWAAPGVLRYSMRPTGAENDGGLRRLNPFREPQSKGAHSEADADRRHSDEL